MSDYADYSPPPNIAYPKSPSSYVVLGIGAFLNSTTPSTLKNFTDGKLYIIKYLAFNGTITNTNTGSAASFPVTMELTRGLNNGGVSSVLLGVGGYYGAAVGSPASFTEWTFAQIDGPILFQAGSAGTPNSLTITASVGAASHFFQGMTYGLFWPVS